MVILRKIIHWLANICYIFIVVYGIICLPMIAGYKPLVVLSGSMEPTLPIGSVIYYTAVEESELKVGDVITFRPNGGENMVTHRIHAVHDNKYETKGDANEVADPALLEYKDIVGRDLEIYIPYLGYYVRFINEHLYVIVIVVIILVSEFLLSNRSSEALDINNNTKGGKENES